MEKSYQYARAGRATFTFCFTFSSSIIALMAGPFSMRSATLSSGLDCAKAPKDRMREVRKKRFLVKYIASCFEFEWNVPAKCAAEISRMCAKVLQLGVRQREITLPDDYLIGMVREVWGRRRRPQTIHLFFDAFQIEEEGVLQGRIFKPLEPPRSTAVPSLHITIHQ